MTTRDVAIEISTEPAIQDRIVRLFEIAQLTEEERAGVARLVSNYRAHLEGLNFGPMNESHLLHAVEAGIATAFEARGEVSR